MFPSIKYFSKLSRSYFYFLFLSLFFLNVGLSVFFSAGFLGKWRIFTNASDSMLPSINRGSLSIVEKRPSTSYDIGDIISFYAQINNREEIITHRVYALGGNVYITKGDNNEAIDAETVRPRMIIGRVIVNIPYLGYWATFLKSGLGNVMFVIIPAIVFIMFEVINIILV